MMGRGKESLIVRLLRQRKSTHHRVRPSFSSTGMRGAPHGKLAGSISSSCFQALSFFLKSSSCLGFKARALPLNGRAPGTRSMLSLVYEVFP